MNPRTFTIYLHTYYFLINVCEIVTSTYSNRIGTTNSGNAKWLPLHKHVGTELATTAAAAAATTTTAYSISTTFSAILEPTTINDIPELDAI